MTIDNHIAIDQASPQYSPKAPNSYLHGWHTWNQIDSQNCLHLDTKRSILWSKFRNSKQIKHQTLCKRLQNPIPNPTPTPTPSHDTICPRSIKLIKNTKLRCNSQSNQYRKSVAYQQANPSAQTPWYRLNRTRNRVTISINQGSKPNQNVSQKIRREGANWNLILIRCEVERENLRSTQS